MGDFGIAGLWLLLALVLIVSILVGAGSVWLADRTLLPKPVAKEHNSTLSPFMTGVGLVYALSSDSPSSWPGSSSPPLRRMLPTRRPP